MNADGTGVAQVTFDQANSGDPTWSPDGTQLAYDTNPGGGQDFDIHIINVDGSGDRFLAGLTATNEEFPAWSPDGTTIVFHGNANGTFDLVFVDVATGALTLGPNSVGEDKFASWSPDGSQVVFAITGNQGTNLAVGARGGQAFTEIIQGVAGQEQFFAGDPSWSR
jgi:Tol biopolymer transport system component